MKTSNLLKFNKSQSLKVIELLNEFKNKIYDNVFFRNLDYLQMESDLIEFNRDSWIQRPNQFCNDIYDEQYYYPVILLVNSIKSPYDFIPNKCINRNIITPTKNAIDFVMSLQYM